MLTATPSPRSLPIIAVAGLAGLAGLAGCGATPPPSSSPGSFYRDIKPIAEAKCKSCHEPGGIGPLPLVTVDDFIKNKAAVRAAVASGRMPPWPAAKGCTDYVGDRSLSPLQAKAFLDWVDQGAPAGRESDYAGGLAEQAPRLTRVDRHLEIPLAYTPTRMPDEYRCFIVDWPEKSTTYVSGTNSIPGNRSIVHHVIAFLATPELVPAFQSLDDQEPGPGYTCFGGPGNVKGPDGQTARVGLLGGWAPGSLGSELPAGTGIKVPAGSKVILQVHYNMSAAKPAPDRTAVDFRVEQQVQKEAFVLPWANFALWVRDRKMPIPAGQADVMHRYALDPTPFFKLFGAAFPLKNGEPFTIHSANLHMHTRGKSARLAIERAGGGGECLLEIPRWDFHWQGNYGFKQAKVFRPGDQLAIECHFDNSPGNQPIIDGQQVAPRDLNWGEGTHDEMCIGFMLVTP